MTEHDEEVTRADWGDPADALEDDAPTDGSHDRGPLRPVMPTSIEETGLSESFLCQLVLKHLYFGGEAEAGALATKLRLHYQVATGLMETLKKQESIMALGGNWSLGGAGIRHALTDRGRGRVEETLRLDNYCGPAPVPFEQYVHQLNSQTIRGHKITPERVAEAFGKLILPPGTLERIGPAVNSGRSIFLYGPPGNGKTSMAECITETIGGEVFVPHAIAVDSEIIRVFDPIYHAELEADFDYDKRWVHSKRPVVVVGGELSLDMLDLTHSGSATFYEAPFQIKAESGVLFIDDFGRQRCDPKQLLNRWIVPLESGFDFLTFRSGQKAKFPFDNLIVFSTNLDPSELVDEAFLRRIRYKIKVDAPTEETYGAILKAVCASNGVSCSDQVLRHLIEEHYRKPGRALTACHPRDLVEQMVDIQKYSGQMPELTPEVIDRLCGLYFVAL